MTEAEQANQMWGELAEGPISRRGIPRMAPSADAKRILTKLQAKPFGTTITVEANVGVIRAAGPVPSTGQP